MPGPRFRRPRKTFDNIEEEDRDSSADEVRTAPTRLVLAAIFSPPFFIATPYLSELRAKVATTLREALPEQLDLHGAFA